MKYIENTVIDAGNSGLGSVDSRPLFWRRVGFAALVISTIAAMCALMVATLSRGGYGLLDFVLTVCFLITLPWTAVGFWNAVIGLWVMRFSHDATRAVCPIATDVCDDSPITAHTALLMCVRNEDTGSVVRNLEVMIEGLAATRTAEQFAVYVLSDSTLAEVVSSEERVFGQLADRWRGIVPVIYRRRDDNSGFKAGNIRDFCERWGHLHDYALVLDADSLMSFETIAQLVRTMQKNPRVGILQTLIVGMPTTSPFARVFQFGMRLGMRSYTLGSAWWQGDCGPYWGHNALIRLQPFIAHCHLPKLPGKAPLGGWILSHDQVEAALMRRAGYEVRVLPTERGSWEENPPSLLEFIRRDLRWCHGNMQYWRLLTMPGLRAVNRVQLALAILMFVGSPAWIAFMTLGMVRVGAADDAAQTFHPELGLALLTAIMVMVFAPKLASLADLLGSVDRSRAFGGRLPVLVGFIGEVLFSTLLASVMAVAHTRFLLGLPFGHAAVWSAQRRASHRVSFRQAFGRLWLQTLFGAGAIVWLALTATSALIGFLPFLLGTVLAVPIAIVSSIVGLGTVLARSRIWRIPDETAPAPELLALHLPALKRDRFALARSEPVAQPAPGE